MILFAIIATLAAIATTFLVWFANGMAAAPGKFQYGGFIAASWVGAAVFWLAWWVD